MNLLSREKFREAVFQRDKYMCIVCNAPATDAHHIIERRLFPDGGYYLDNGVSVCSDCHIKCEQTTISCEHLRYVANIKRVVVPPHLYVDYQYDKWGNLIIAENKRARGELFNDPSVQKILEQGGVLDQFTNYVKYPRTFHLPWSPGATKDDRILTDLSFFIGKSVVVTEKMDGENTSLYNDYLHARSINSGNHPSRAWIKKVHAEIMQDIPAGWRICAENLYAKHSIHYADLSNYVQVFSIWDEYNRCLSWDETVEWCNLLGLTHVPVLYRGIWDETKIRAFEADLLKGGREGYVVRLEESFSYCQFKNSIAKFVREGHVQQGHGHWMRSKLILNETQTT